MLDSNNEDVLRHILFHHSVVGPRFGFGRLAAAVGLVPLRLTAMVRSAFTAAIGAIGSGSRMPPSASSRPSRMCGVITPGMAMDARIAASTGPRCSHTDLPAIRSVVTAV